MSFDHPEDLSRALAQAGIIDTKTQRLMNDTVDPWWLQVLLAIAAWIASLLIISSLIGPVLALADNNGIRTAAALCLLGVALWLADKPNAFIQQMTLGFALAAQGLLVFVCYDAFDHNDELARYVAAALAIGLLYSPLNGLHQRVSLSIAFGCLLSLLHSAILIAVVTNVMATAAIVLWCSRPRWAGLGYAATLKSLLDVLTLSALLLAVYGQSLGQFDLAVWLLVDVSLAQHVFSMLAMLVLLATALWLSRHATLPSRLLIAGTTLMAGITLYSACGLLIAAALMLACFYGCSRRWFVLCLLSMLLTLSEFYYSLQLSLLYKSAALALGGAVMLAAWYLLQRYQRNLLSGASL